MKRLLSLAAAAALAASPVFAQNGPAAGARGGGIAQEVGPIGGAAVPVEVALGAGAIVLIALIAGSGGSDGTSSTTTTVVPPS